MSSSQSSFMNKIHKDSSAINKDTDEIENTNKKMLKSGARYGERINFLHPSPHVDSQDGTPKHRSFDINLYATKKSAAQGLLDLALLMANASQLKHIILTDGEHRFYGVMIGLLSASIILQIIVAIGLLFLARIRIFEYYMQHHESEEKQEEEKDAAQRMELVKQDEKVQRKLRQADFLNNLIVAGILIITVINVFISAFGLNESPRKDHGYMRDAQQSTTPKQG